MIFAYLNLVHTHFLHLIDISKDYRRVFWVIPWAVLVAVYLLTYLPAWILGGFLGKVSKQTSTGSLAISKVN